VTRPTRVLDLHVHVFNARCLPLAGIFKQAMGVERSVLADVVAWILARLTGSTFGDEAIGFEALKSARSVSNATAIRLICDIAVNEVQRTAPTGSSRALTASDMAQWQDTDLMRKLTELSEIDYAAEPRRASRGRRPKAPAPLATGAEPPTTRDALDWVRATLRRGIEELVLRLRPTGWAQDGIDYLEFILTMLRSEDAIFRQYVRSMGTGLGPVTCVHHMMDMQMAYKGNPAPYYKFHPVQRDRMLQLQKNHAPSLLGFCAFDPRRTDWREMMRSAKNEGFLGFKFYPGMGFAPSGNKKEIQDRIDGFFEECADPRCDTPIFAHCTPKGFEAYEKAGLLSAPAGWQKVLSCHTQLRLCLGHAGGGWVDKVSAGWMATDAEWKPGNYAYDVVDLCVTYKNVYCEVGVLMQVMTQSGFKRFRDNLDRACAMKGNHAFLKKLAYGSDWHMPAMVQGPRDYFERFVEMFNSSPDLVRHIDDFFWHNAMNYLSRRG
jgi:Amidohydrolase